MESTNKQDAFIHNLIREKGLETAPDKFTDNVMKKIREQTSIEMGPLLSPLSWILIGLGLLTAISMLFLIDVPFCWEFFQFNRY